MCTYSTASPHPCRAKCKGKAFYSWLEPVLLAEAMEGKWDHMKDDKDISSTISTASSCGHGNSSQVALTRCNMPDQLSVEVNGTGI